MNDNEDILVWPDLSWCYRHELQEMGGKSDDYEVVKANTNVWCLLYEVLS